MKILMLFIAAFIFDISPNWLTNFDEAQKIALHRNGKILLNFSGSDWCVPCMRLQGEIFNSAAFKNYAVHNLVLVNADFPRNKRNQLNKEQVKHNETLAERYNPKGKFPYTLLLNARGDVIKVWDGLPDVKTGEFVKQIMMTEHGHN